MTTEKKLVQITGTSRPARALWIEIASRENGRLGTRSRPARALWIEIYLPPYINKYMMVEAREGLVD